MLPFKHLILSGLLLVLAGCASTGKITNTSISEPLQTHRQQITSGMKGQRSDDTFLYIGMSGGGTRAAALSYGILQELRDTTYPRNGKEQRLLDEIDYISSVSDGGITDNLGIRSLYDRVELMGGARNATNDIKHRPKYIVINIVNAATRPDNPMDSSSDIPSSVQVVGAVSATQIDRYTVESLSLLEEAFTEWATELSTPTQPVIPYFIKLDFESIDNKKQRKFFNNMATSFSLPNDQVDKLIEAGHKLLRQSPEFQKLLETIREEDKT